MSNSEDKPEKTELELEETIQKVSDEIVDTIVTESLIRMKIESTKNTLVKLIDADKEIKKEEIDKILHERTKKIDSNEEMLDEALENGDIRKIEDMLKNMMK